jgi:hypothetical protein
VFAELGNRHGESARRKGHIALVLSTAVGAYEHSRELSSFICRQRARLSLHWDHLTKTWAGQSVAAMAARAVATDSWRHAAASPACVLRVLGTRYYNDAHGGGGATASAGSLGVRCWES